MLLLHHVENGEYLAYIQLFFTMIILAIADENVKLLETKSVPA